MPEATVVISDLPYDDDGSKYVEDVKRAQIHYLAFNNYDQMEGIHVMGITSPEGFKNQSVAFIQLSTRTNLWVFKWTTSCFGDKPQIPDGTPLNSDWVLLQSLPEVPNVTVGPDGETPLRRISGTYVYGKKNPTSDPFDAASYPRPVFLEDVFDRRVKGSEKLVGMGDTGGSDVGGSKGNQGDVAYPSLTAGIVGG